MNLYKHAGFLSRALAATPLAYLPVRVRAGAARGARWTLLPFSNNWRRGGEGDLEPALAHLVKLRGAVGWDFGAHFGLHTVGMAMQFGPTGEVAAFEPNPIAFDRLQLHVKLNQLTNVKIFPVGVSDSDGKLPLITADRNSSVSHFAYENEPTSATTPIMEVPVITADELAAKNIIRLPDIIKVDVQGHGGKAIAGAIQSIRTAWPVIVFSNHSRFELSLARKLLEGDYSIVNFAGHAISWEILNTKSGMQTGILLPRRAPYK